MVRTKSNTEILTDAYLMAVYPPGVVQRLRQCLTDHRKDIAKWEMEVERIQSLLNDISQILEDADPSELAEFLQGERELRYNDLRQARAKLATAEGKAMEAEKMLRRAELAQRYLCRSKA